MSATCLLLVYGWVTSAAWRIYLSVTAKVLVDAAPHWLRVLFFLTVDLTAWNNLMWIRLHHISQEIHRVRKKNCPPKHIQITLWIENNSHYFSLYHEKPSICNVCVKFHDNQPVRCWDIAFYKKMVENCRCQHCQLTRERNAYLRPPILTPAHCASAFT